MGTRTNQKSHLYLLKQLLELQAAHFLPKPYLTGFEVHKEAECGREVSLLAHSVEGYEVGSEGHHLHACEFWTADVLLQISLPSGTAQYLVRRHRNELNAGFRRHMFYINLEGLT